MTRSSSLRFGALLTAALVLSATGVLSASAAPSTASAGDSGAAAAPQEYVALGDSWSADVVFLDGNGTPDSTHAPVDCAQSHTNYPKLLAAELGITDFRDATCGSAKTDHFYAPQSLPLGGTNPPQFDRLTPTTDLVTMGIGGNDAGIASAATDCLGGLPVDAPDGPVRSPAGGCKDTYAPEGGEDRLARQIEESEPKLVAAIEEIRRRSPEARILVVDYLAAVPEHACYPRVPITEEDMVYLHATFLRLNEMVRSAAAAGGAELVDTFTPTLGHDVCQGPTVRYAEVYGPSVNGPAVGVPAHPNSAGAAAQFRAVLAQVQAP
ncbi:SGNH/GDSL hydrolase family protein [Nocardioides donggukensis]|uniref:SGNH/GDSL hydrolase family protein n=1 Tax=Nocardioides donggukensis TaxID=2774019 RepID=A0A927Q2F0_9ACTN|nr:SGNH/GDSL hydrolase family protein [Nocardioides donggukensis]MBD8870329.1 SGNH/GDSL hydrolase family protein [Nocardioides donggukensis]